MDAEYKRKVKEDLARTFKNDDRPPMEKLRSWLGFSQKEEKPKAYQPASYSPWERMQREKNR